MSVASEEAPARVDLGGIVIDFDRNVAETGEGPKRLEPKPAHLLRILIENRGAVMLRTDLIDLVWDGDYGADHRLSTAVSTLRKLLAPAANAEIETVPKRGYRFVGNPRIFEAERSRCDGEVQNTEGDRDKTDSVALLSGYRARQTAISVFLGLIALVGLVVVNPLNLGQQSVPYKDNLFQITAPESNGEQFANEQVDTFRDRLPGSLARALSRNFLLSSRANDGDSAAEFRLISAISVDASEVSADVRLVHAPNDVHIWTQSMSRNRNVLRSFDEEIGAKLSQSLRCFLRERAKYPDPSDPKLLNLLIQLCDASEAGRVKFATLVEMSRQLVAYAPDVAAAHSKYAGSLAFEIYFRYGAETAEIMAKRKLAHDHIDRALALDADNGAAYWARGILNDNTIGILSRMDDFKRALDVDPDYPYSRNHLGHLLYSIGRVREASAYYRRFVGDFPLNRQVPPNYAYTLMALGEKALARSVIEPMLQRDHGRDASILRGRWFKASLWFGDPEEAKSLLKKMDYVDGRSPCLGAFFSARLEDRRLTVEEIQTACEDSWFERPFAIYGFFGHVDETLDQLNAQAEVLGAPSNVWDRRLLFASFLSPLHDDPRFIAFADRIGLVDVWRETGVWPDFCSRPTLPYDCVTEAAALSAKMAVETEL